MKHTHTHRLLSRRNCVALLMSAALAAPCLAFAAPSAPVQVRNAWIRWLPAGLPAGGYMQLQNQSARPIDLIGASSPDYGRVMLHHSVMKDGTMQMLPVARLTIPAGGDFEFKPGGYHIMLMQPVHAVKPGDQVAVTLRFAGGSPMTVHFLVRKADATGGMRSMPMGGDKH